MEHNLQYRRLNGLGEMLMAVVQKPRSAAPVKGSQGSDEGEWMSIRDISDLLKTHFKGYKEDDKTFQKIGNYLSRPEYKFHSKHSNTGALYWVKRI